MYKVACPLSREMLLALYLLKHTMLVSRIRDESTHGRRWHSPTWAMKHWWVYCGIQRGSAAVGQGQRYVLSLCAIPEMVRSDPTQNCSGARVDALSCQGQSHDETPWRRGHTFTSPLPLSLAEGTHSLPPRSALSLGDIVSHAMMSPVIALRRSCLAGHSTSGGGGESSCTLHTDTAISYDQGEAEIKGTPYTPLCSLRQTSALI